MNDYYYTNIIIITNSNINRLITGWVYGLSDDIIKTSSIKGNNMVTLAWLNILQYPHPSEIKVAETITPFNQAIDSVENLLLSSEYLLSRASSHQDEGNPYSSLSLSSLSLSSLSLSSLSSLSLSLSLSLLLLLLSSSSS